MKTVTHKETSNEHLQIIRQVAWQLHLRYNLDVNDLYSEGALQYLLKKDKYVKKENAKFSTYLWLVIKNSLINYIKDQVKVQCVVPIEDIVDLSEYPPTPAYKKYPLKETFICGCF